MEYRLNSIGNKPKYLGDYTALEVQSLITAIDNRSGSSLIGACDAQGVPFARYLDWHEKRGEINSRAE
tara:strand:- start:2483 stop:2686 length:204 start_codon:yes stop_codon:yes gene_type:complete